jgi:hypothetical protein
MCGMTPCGQEHGWRSMRKFLCSMSEAGWVSAIGPQEVCHISLAPHRCDGQNGVSRRFVIALPLSRSSRTVTLTM